jgi:hypothetical protein
MIRGNNADSSSLNSSLTMPYNIVKFGSKNALKKSQGVIMKKSFFRFWIILLFFVFFSTGCQSYQEQVSEYPYANFIYTDCSDFKQMLDERGVSAMTFFSTYDGEPDEITEDRVWEYIDKTSSNEENSRELYRLVVNRNFSFSILDVWGELIKYTVNGKVFYKVYFEWNSSWLTGGTVDVYIDVDNNIMLMYNPLRDIYLFGYIDENEEGFLYK